jgi:2TM family of unknown function (DUF5676)
MVRLPCRQLKACAAHPALRTSESRLWHSGLASASSLRSSFTLCVLAGLVLPDWSLHQPWLQFFPGFTWLTWPSFLLGLIESFAYGWYVALIFGPLYNLFAARGG